MTSTSRDAGTRIREAVLAVAPEVAKLSDGRIRLAHQEEDTATTAAADAAHFFKVDERRRGRDLELYAFMATFSGPELALAELAELAISLKTISEEAYTTLASCLTKLGDALLKGERKTDYRAIFA